MTDCDISALTQSAQYGSFISGRSASYGGGAFGREAPPMLSSYRPEADAYQGMILSFGSVFETGDDQHRLLV